MQIEKKYWDLEIYMKGWKICFLCILDRQGFSSIDITDSAELVNLYEL